MSSKCPFYTYFFDPVSDLKTNQLVHAPDTFLAQICKTCQPGLCHAYTEHPLIKKCLEETRMDILASSTVKRLKLSLLQQATFSDQSIKDLNWACVSATLSSLFRWKSSFVFAARFLLVSQLPGFFWFYSF